MVPPVTATTRSPASVCASATAAATLRGPRGRAAHGVRPRHDVAVRRLHIGRAGPKTSAWSAADEQRQRRGPNDVVAASTGPTKPRRPGFVHGGPGDNETIVDTEGVCGDSFTQLAYALHDLGNVAEHAAPPSGSGGCLSPDRPDPGIPVDVGTPDTRDLPNPCGGAARERDHIAPPLIAAMRAFHQRGRQATRAGQSGRASARTWRRVRGGRAATRRRCESTQEPASRLVFRDCRRPPGAGERAATPVRPGRAAC
ncbi:hypothetical protein SAMN05421684_7560 [Asanoa ishikariensis]|uniref:Uncharacterized protein n=1 Tax=Asanoa ishikariensis TaxID=137265 RepID=A0A1H3UP49_9ACTN|nr:hypothetical protein SAMN05421684_7560 [Asanoa ishikariensis]